MKFATYVDICYISTYKDICYIYSKYICVSVYIQIHKLVHNNKEEILMPIIVLISMTGHMVVTGIYNYLLSLPILYFLCLQREAFKHPSWLWFFAWWGDPNLHN